MINFSINIMIENNYKEIILHSDMYTDFITTLHSSKECIVLLSYELQSTSAI